MGNPDERVELLRTGDPMRAQMLREMLEGEGIAVATPGLEHRAMLGPLAGYVEIVVQVPRAEVARAWALIEALDAAPLEGLALDDDGPVEEVVDYRTSARGVSTVSGKQRRVALVASMVLPGGGHVYVAEWRSAAVIALTEVTGLVFALRGMPFAGALIVLAVLADMAGGTWHCERLAGASSGSVRRFAPELAALLGMMWIGLQLAAGAA